MPKKRKFNKSSKPYIRDPNFWKKSEEFGISKEAQSTSQNMTSLESQNKVPNALNDSFKDMPPDPAPTPSRQNRQIVLMDIINHEETTAKLSSENNFELAYVKALKQSKYNSKIQSISNLVSLYKFSVKANMLDSVSRFRDKITSIIRNKTQLTASEVKSVSDDLCVQKKYLKSILFYSIAFSLFEGNNDPDNDVKNMRRCVWGINILVEEMLKEDQNIKNVVQYHVIPLMHELKSRMENLPGVNAELKVVKLCECLCHIGYCKRLAGIDGFQTNTEGLRLMDTIENKQNYKVYGHLLNNIGEWHERKLQYSEAVSKYTEAIEAYKQATDWLNDVVKQEFINKIKNRSERLEN